MSRNHRSSVRDGLTYDLDHARDLAYTLAHILALFLDSDSDPARNLALVHAQAQSLAHAIEHAIDCDLVPEGYLDRALAHALDQAQSLSNDRDQDNDVANVFNAASLHARDNDLIHGFDPDAAVRRVVRLLDSARRNAGLLMDVGNKAAVDRVGVRVSGSARWLVGVASRMVPVAERSRYAEEWRGELWELGQQTQRFRRRQLVHALRLLSRAWGVRGGVRAARRRPAGG
jgi:hypothetical protein